MKLTKTKLSGRMAGVPTVLSEIDEPTFSYCTAFEFFSIYGFVDKDSNDYFIEATKEELWDLINRLHSILIKKDSVKACMEDARRKKTK